MGNSVMLHGGVTPAYHWSAPPDTTRMRPPAQSAPSYTTDQAPTCITKPKGRVPSLDEMTTMKAVVVDTLPDRFNPRNGLSHQVLMVKVTQIVSGPTTADKTDPVSVKGKVIEVDNDISPCIGSKAPVKPGQQVFIRGELYHNDARGDKPEKDGIHWTHHADKPRDAGYIQVAVKGKLKTYE